MSPTDLPTSSRLQSDCEPGHLPLASRVSRLPTRPRPTAAKRSRFWGLAITTYLVVGAGALAACGSGSSSHTSTQSSSASSSQANASSVRALINTGIAQANAKQYQQAETTFRDLLVLSPANKFAWYNLGLIAQVQNHPSAAVADYSKAIAGNPTYTPAMYNMAILLEASNLHSALELYRRITSINPKAATAYLRESFVYARLGDKAKAAQARARAIALDSRLKAVKAPP